ncbi:MAG: exosome complex RNA-binding protein Csl4 [Candidatus Micrarchaeota archaeon]
MEKKILLPGDHVGPGEVYEAGPSTYVEKDEVYASAVGALDEEARVLRARSGKIPFTKGIVVYGIVVSVFENFAIVGIVPEKAAGGKLTGADDGKILVKNASKEYTRSMRDAFRVGDIIRAKVVEVDADTLMLSTAYPEYGVIKAFCSRDRAVLERAGRDLACPVCKGRERRKTANDYRAFGKINV